MTTPDPPEVRFLAPAPAPVVSPAPEPVAEDDDGEPNTKLQVLLFLVAAGTERVSRSALRASLPDGASMPSPDGSRRRLDRGSKARGNYITDRLRRVVMRLERDGLIRREPEFVVIVDRAGVVAALARAQSKAAAREQRGQASA